MSELVLLNIDIKILKKIKNRPYIGTQKINKHMRKNCSDRIRNLYINDFIMQKHFIEPHGDGVSVPLDEYCLADKGIAYFEHRRREWLKRVDNWIRFAIPVTLSIIALIISALALYLQYTRI